MEDLIETIMRGNVVAVKVVLTSIVTAIAVYQVFLMSATSAMKAGTMWWWL